MSNQQISSVSIDRACPWRAFYVWMEDGEVQQRRDNVVGWAAVGLVLFPVRIDPTSGQGVLIGSAHDKDAECLMGVLGAGESWEDLPGADERVRAMVLAEVESGDAEEG